MIRLLFILILCLSPTLGISQVKVPAHAVTITFPKRSAGFQIQNTGTTPVIVQVDLAERSNVRQPINDGLAIIYPHVSRIEPGAIQRINVSWRGKMDRSHYYLARINTVNEEDLQKDRKNTENKKKGLQVRVGQAFPIHIEAPETRPKLVLMKKSGGAVILNKGLRGDYIDALRLSDGNVIHAGTFITPGQEITLPNAEFANRNITAIKLRRFGWVTLSDN